MKLALVHVRIMLTTAKRYFFGAVLVAGLLASLLVAGCASTNTSCESGNHPCYGYVNQRGNNAPRLLNHVTLAPQNTYCTVSASATKPADMVAAFTDGLQAVNDFLGKWGTDCHAFVFKWAGSDTEYANMQTAIDAFDKIGFTNLVSQAKSATSNRGQLHMVQAYQVPESEYSSCPSCCNSALQQHNAYHKAGVVSMSTSFNWNQAVHEYVHAYQVLNAYTWDWMMEGGADHVTCMLLHLKPTTTTSNDAYDYGSTTNRNYQQCIVDGIRSAYTQYTRPLLGGETRTILEKYGSYDGSSQFETDYGLASGSAFHDIVYKGGLAALVYAIYKSGKTSQEFWVGPTSPWLNNDVNDHINSVNYLSTYPSTMTDQQGFRKSFLAFLGNTSNITSIADFYTGFDTWMRNLTDPSTNQIAFDLEVKSILENDTDMVNNYKSYYSTCWATEARWHNAGHASRVWGECADGSLTTSTTGTSGFWPTCTDTVQCQTGVNCDTTVSSALSR